MAFISAFGTGSAARTRGWARSALLTAAALPLLGAAPVGRLEVAIEALRSREGQVRLCLTRLPAQFPNCAGAGQVWTRSAAAGSDPIVFTDVPSGDYAVSAFHDRNGNGKLDTFLGVPREGFGFSRNPPIRFGPPAFGDARFTVSSGSARQNVRMKYFL